MQNKSAYIWGLLNRFLPSLLSIVATMIMARFLTPEDFGAIGVVSIVFFVARTLIDSGFGGSLINEKDIKDIDYSTVSVFNLVMGLGLYGLIIVFSGIIEDYFGILNLRYVVILLGLTLVISPFGLVPNTILQKNLRFSDLCKISVISIILANVISLVMAFYGFGVYALVANQVLQSLFSVILLFAYSHYRFSFHFSYNSLRKLFSFGFFTALSSMVDEIYENLLTSLTGKYLNVQQAGYLSQSKRLEEAFSISLTSAISTVSFPILSKIKDNENAFMKECESIYRIILLISVPLLVIIAIFSKEVIFIMLGSQWIEASFYLKVLSVAGIFMVMETLIRIFIKSHGDAPALFYYTVLKRVIGICLIILCMLISRDLMIYGYVAGSFIAFVINSILFCRITRGNVLRLLLQTTLYTIPSLIIWAGIYVIDLFTAITLVGRIIYVTIAFMIYTIIVLRVLGYNLILKRIFK